MSASKPIVTSAIEAAGGPSVVARRLKVSVQAACFWRDGERLFPEKHGAELESACGGKYTRKDMWPDEWQTIWPELSEAEPVTQAGVL